MAPFFDGCIMSISVVVFSKATIGITSSACRQFRPVPLMVFEIRGFKLKNKNDNNDKKKKKKKKKKKNWRNRLSSCGVESGLSLKVKA